jgi:glutathione S-transferase
MIEVLGRTMSINVRKVLWTCVETGLDFTHIPWGEGELDIKSPEYLALNPNGMIPVIRDGDFVLWESNAICRYLADRANSMLYPADVRQRALVNQWMDWQLGDLNNAWRYAFLGLVRKSAKHTDPEAIRASADAWNRQMRILDTHLAHQLGKETGAGGGFFVAGATMTLADIVLALSAHRWKHTPIERPHLPALEDWYAMLAQRPGFCRWTSARVP